MSDLINASIQIPEIGRTAFVRKVFRMSCTEWKFQLISPSVIKDKDKRMGIYAILNIKTNEFYIGSAKNVHERRVLHLFKLRTNQKTNKNLKNAFLEDGEDCLCFILIQAIQDEKLLESAEQFWVNELNPKYNIAKNIHRIRHTEEGKRKIGEYARIHNALKGWKAVLQYDKAGNFIKEWPSIQHVERELGINNAHISATCRGNGKYKSAGGFVWKYKNPV